MKSISIIILSIFVALTSFAQTSEPYIKLDRAVSSGEHKNTVPFVGLDYNYSGIRLSAYLQNDLGLINDKFEVKPTQLIQKYRSGSSGLSFVITYNIENRHDIIGSSELGNNAIAIIKSVEIVGSYEAITKLYALYWDTQFQPGSYKKGEAIIRNYWGDKITLSIVSDKLLKISIGKGIDVNYEENFGIHAKRN